MKAVLDSIVAEKFDGSVIVGRGVPQEWLDTGKPIELKRLPVSAGRIDVTIRKTAEKTYELDLGGAAPDQVVFDLPVFAGKPVSLQKGQRSVVVAVP